VRTIAGETEPESLRRARNSCPMSPVWAKQRPIWPADWWGEQCWSQPRTVRWRG